MKLTYVPVKIAKSTTLLVTSTVEASLRTQTAGWLLRHTDEAEQAVFADWNGDEPQLGTASGALNVNGAMALCAWLALQNDLPLGETWSFPLPLSAVPAPLPCAVTTVNTCCIVTVTMPDADFFSVRAGDLALPAVRFPGVSHVIAPAGAVSRVDAAELLRRWSRTLPDPAVGLLFWNGDALSFDPLILDGASGAAVWRQSCGSAAAAVGAYLAGRAGETVSLKQPGGIMAVTRADALTVTATAEVGRSKTVDLVF